MNKKQTVRAPFTTDETEKLANRIYRKQVLRYTDIDYHGRKVTFDRPYAENVVAAFRDNAFDTVPFVLADSDNKHTRDPERARGEVVDLEATDTGLDAIITLNQDAARIVEQNPKFGVSVSIKEQFSRADGKSYPAALAHVLGTFEPMLPGMSPWQTINASVENEEVLDLTQIDLSKNQQEEKHMGKYSPEEQDALFSRLEEFLNAQIEGDEEEGEHEDAAASDEGHEGVEDSEEEELTADEVEELRAFLAEYDAAQHETVNASQEQDPRALELSQTLERQQQEIHRLRAENDRRAYETEKQEIAQTHGIPPHIVDLARPLLQGSNRVVELSETGKSVDAGKVMRDVFAAIGKQITLLDLSGEIGNNLDFSREEEEDHDARMGKIKSIRKQMNI